MLAYDATSVVNPLVYWEDAYLYTPSRWTELRWLGNRHGGIHQW